MLSILRVRSEAPCVSRLCTLFPLGCSDGVCGISDDHLHGKVEISGPVLRWRAWQSYERDLCVHKEPSLPQGSTSFKDSSEYRSIRESHSYGSSDYDSWDSGDTDWDSDW